MTTEEWDTLALLLDKGFKWREPFGTAHETTYRVLLEGYEGEQIAYALRALIARGQVFGPTPGEIVAVIRHDPERPTFAELLAQLYDAGGVFGFKRSNVTISPWVTAFVERYGRERLRMLEINDPDRGGLRLRDLEQSWTAFLEATEGRAIHELAARSGRGTLGRIDPLAAIEGGK
jgi:hypothetical protein